MMTGAFEKWMFGFSIFTLMTQLYVLFLIKYKSSPPMLEYRLFLYLMIIWDILFVFSLGILWQPYVVVPLFAAKVDGLGRLFGFQFCLVNVSHLIL
jgi:hypothetical protein